MAYILKLLAKLKDATPEEHEKRKKALIELVSGNTQLRSKRELIEKFIHENLPEIEDSDDIPEEFNKFWDEERINAIKALSTEENLDLEKVEKVIGDYLFTEKIPIRDEIIATMKTRPRLNERGKTAERVTDKIQNFVETFISRITGKYVEVE